MRGKRESYLSQGDGRSRLVGYELKDDEKEQYLAKGRDSIPLNRFIIVYYEIVQLDLHPEIKSELLPDVSSFNSYVQGYKCAPFR